MESGSDMTEWENDVDITSRSIYVGRASSSQGGEEIGPDALARLLQALVILERKSSSPITIYLNTEGGCLWNVMGMCDIIAASSLSVTMVGVGRVWSSGSILMQAADHRMMSPNTTMLLHGGDMSVSGHPLNGKAWVEAERSMTNIVASMYAERSQKDANYFKRVMNRAQDTIYTAKEALELGLIDEVGYV